MKRPIHLTVSAYAEHRGCPRRKVQEALAAGRIAKGRDGKIDPTKADRMWRENTGAQGGHAAAREERAARARGAAPPETSYAEARRRKELAKAVLAQLDAQERQGLLVRVEVVAREWTRVCRAARDRVLGLTDRLAPYAVAETDLDRMRARIDSELRDALEGLAADLMARAPDAGREEP